MGRPTKVSLQSGQASWDADLSDDLRIIFDGPFPVFRDTDELTLEDVEAAYPAADYEECVFSANLNDGALVGVYLLYSDGTTWRVLNDERGTWRTIVKPSDQDGIGEASTDITGLGIPVKAGDILHFRIHLWKATNATTTGGVVSVNGPTASLVRFHTRETNGVGSEAVANQSAFDAFSTRANGPGATVSLDVITGFAVFTADGTFIPRAHAETGSGGTMDIKSRSWMEYMITR